MNTIVSPTNYNTIAIDAANCHRAIDALLDEFENISPGNPQSITLFERFASLHAEFYKHIITLTGEETGVVDRVFQQAVYKESQKLAQIIQYLKTEKGFLEIITRKITGRSNTMADYFARCVADIFEGFDVDPKTNEIVFISD